ncbi:MAG: type II toxin-antitoxin system RelB family antitoxin [Cetobacterium sp.]|uniref:type II toxin-antitoxin system RelB family antitoxin n=1 Tax=Cetobacterium sp. TaxID=2071632 RepID=UPI003EE43FAD
MKTISLRLDDQDEILLKNYTKINNISLSEFVRNAIFEKIEDSLLLDEKKIVAARRKSKKEKSIPSEDVWKTLGVE